MVPDSGTPDTDLNTDLSTDLSTVTTRTIAVYEAVRSPLARIPGNRPDVP